MSQKKRERRPDFDREHNFADPTHPVNRPDHPMRIAGFLTEFDVQEWFPRSDDSFGKFLREQQVPHSRKVKGCRIFHRDALVAWFVAWCERGCQPPKYGDANDEKDQGSPGPHD